MAKICAQTSIAEMHIQMNNLDTAKQQLESCEEALAAFGGVSVMHAAYYRVSAEWNKIKGDFAAFYTDALRFLGCTSLDELSSGWFAGYLSPATVAAGSTSPGLRTASLPNSLSASLDDCS